MAEHRFTRHAQLAVLVRCISVFLIAASAVDAAAAELASEHAAITNQTRSTKVFIAHAERFLDSDNSPLSRDQQTTLKLSSLLARLLIELDCKLLTLDNPASTTDGTEHQLQFDACQLNELERRAERMKQFVCPEANFEGRAPDCEALRELEARR